MPRPFRILLVEDNQDFREGLAATLVAEIKAYVSECDNGSDGALWAHRENFDLIITDIQMPFMDGNKFIKSLRHNPGPNKHTPVIVISGHQKVSEKLGEMVYSISKPIHEEDLFNLISQIKS